MFCFQDTEVKPIFNNNKRAVDFLCVFFKLGAEERKSSKWKTKLFLILVFTSTRLNNIILMVPNILFGRKNVFQQSVMIFLLKTSELPSDPSTVSGLELSAWLVLKCTNYRTGGGRGGGVLQYSPDKYRRIFLVSTHFCFSLSANCDPDLGKVAGKWLLSLEVMYLHV